MADDEEHVIVGRFDLLLAGAEREHSELVSIAKETQARGVVIAMLGHRRRAGDDSCGRPRARDLGEGIGREMEVLGDVAPEADESRCPDWRGALLGRSVPGAADTA
jgi:hypothetical protein